MPEWNGGLNPLWPCEPQGERSWNDQGNLQTTF